MVISPRLPRAVTCLLPTFVGRIGLGGIPLIRRYVSWLVINRFDYSTKLRLRVLSLASDYTSWLSLTDRIYSGRQGG